MLRQKKHYSLCLIPFFFVPLRKNFAQEGRFIKYLWDYYKKNAPVTHSLRSSWRRVFTLIFVKSKESKAQRFLWKAVACLCLVLTPIPD